MSAYRKFSDVVRNELLVGAAPNPPKAPKITDEQVMIAQSVGGLGTLGGPKGKSENLIAAPEVKLLAPSSWFERAAPPADREPGYELPCLARRGRVEQRDGVLLHFCVECGRWGTFGFDVFLRAGRPGHWYCAEHRPEVLRDDR
jgi:hypothetical protein